MDHDLACDERKQEDSDIALNVNQQHCEDGLNQQTSSPASLYRDNGENMEQDSDAAEERMVPSRGGLPSDDGSCGDNNDTTPINKESKDKVGYDDTGEGKVRESTTSSTEGDKYNDPVDGTKASLNVEPTDVKDTNTEAPEALESFSEPSAPKDMAEQNTATNPKNTAGDKKGDTNMDHDSACNEYKQEDSDIALNAKQQHSEDDGRGPEKDTAFKAEKDIQEHATFPQTPLAHEISKEEELAEERQKDIETIGPTTEEKTKHSVPEVTGACGDSDPAEKRTAPSSGGGPSLAGIGIIVAVSIVVLAVVLPLLQPESPQKTLQQIEIFHQEMEKVKSKFPNQRPELWKRSRIHLERHLNTTQPTEPVSLILTALPGAERTLHCLARGLAFTFSSALNASVLHIDGASKASQDSDEVKLYIDQQLRAAFEGDKPVAVIHRFEELPPGSTLIFYRYCDHENAAYKKTFLIFTVLLEEENEDLTKIRLSSVEEMVDDHLQKKFISHGHPVAFDRMDLDKYGGLWSRISHLILPVAADKNIEHGRCQWT
ncbi:torsin-1A-interacting protein 2-like isoform X1 [Thunnus albacares]|uniref:torsin-1A-interacting protein 2-like isoform X1 n=1 Tax=Thunnus albacares TaxID=8236 RepID=UPI001CF61B7C|nr:torsin-1A-interacting protein 2-like isoform X1 [Thunnus albacares]XP_044217307.1 torsin-1A-interacting protein 2-like isoform X1 [Thunnus albacares]